MKRRDFLQLLAASGYGYLAHQLAACAPVKNGGVSSSLLADGEVTMFDILMEGWSTFGSGFLGDNGILLAQEIKDNKDLTKPYVQDNDGHKFTLTPDHFGKLRRGELVKVVTTVANSHNHEVRINPKKKAPNAKSLTMPIDPNAAPGGTTPPPGQPQPQETIYATLEEKDNPTLYVTGSKTLQDGTVEFCFDERARCEADQNLWRAMRRYQSSAKPGLQVYAGDSPLGLASTDPARREFELMVRAKLGEGGQVLKQLMKVVKK